MRPFCRELAECSSLISHSRSTFVNIHHPEVAMPGKRISVAACLAALEAARKARRAGSSDDASAATSGTGDGPVIACARRWGSAAWVLEGSAGLNANRGFLHRWWVKCARTPTHTHTHTEAAFFTHGLMIVTSYKTSRVYIESFDNPQQGFCLSIPREPYCVRSRRVGASVASATGRQQSKRLRLQTLNVCKRCLATAP